MAGFRSVVVRVMCGALSHHTPKQIKWCYVAILPQTTFSCCKSFGVLRTPSRRGRVRCTHQHQDEIKSYHVAILLHTIFPCRNSLGVQSTPRGRVRCAHQHHDKSNRITWSSFYTRFFHTASLSIYWCARRTLQPAGRKFFCDITSRRKSLQDAGRETRGVKD